jgi:glycosyltransferase involved in cell wall biosynthesis
MHRTGTCVSVIIPTRNRAQFVTNAIDSVLLQTFRDYEIIVIDDGSSDNTRDVLQPYLTRINYIYQNNQGVSVARNTGIRTAKGEWIAFLDDDDEWLPDYLLVQMTKALQNPEACMHMTNSEEVSQDGAKANTFNLKDIGERIERGSSLIIRRPLQFIIEKHITSLQSTIVKRQSLLNAGLFDPLLSIAEDHDVIARVALEGPLGICNHVLVYIIRRDEPVGKKLTSQLCLKGIYSRRCIGTVYKKILSISILSKEEKLAVKRKLGQNQRALGNLLLRDDQLREARECYRDALRVYPSAKSIMRYLFSFLPKQLALNLIFKGRNVKP